MRKIGSEKAKNIGIFLSFLAFSFLSFTLISPIVSSNAETSIRSAQIDTGPYTMSISTDSLTSIDITPAQSQATYTGTDSVSYTNTCPYGMNVTMSSSSENTSLTRTGSDSGMKTIPTISSGTALADNTWGFSTDNGSTYNPIPALINPATIIDTTSATTTTATLNLSYGIRMDNSIPSGNYSNDIVYTVSPKQQCLSYGVTWDLDGGTAATGTTYPSSLGFGQTLDLSTLTPTKSGYILTGWSNGTDTFIGTETDADINPNNLASLTMTAQWEQVLPMQGFICSTLTNVGDTVKLRDTRDNNIYTVKKLKDGKCWMTENLRLINKTISSADSNLPSGETYTVPASNLSSFTDDYNTNAAYIDSTYGGYYNFYTATAGTGGTSLTSGNTPSSICPKGWRLPTGGDSGEFNTLYGQYNSAALMMDVPNFTLSGDVDNGSVYDQGDGGFFWSSTVNDANLTYGLSLVSSGVNPVSNGNKSYGDPVRCVAVDTMQNYDPSSLSNTGDTTTLIDTRDGNLYTVKKLADGKVWMTQNLRLIKKTISSADSNLPEGETWTIPASSVSGFSAHNTNNAYLDSNHGGYYTFYTATASWGTNRVTSGNAPKDICPKGWRLPTGGSSGEFQTLYNNYNSSALMQGEPNFTLSGFMSNGSVSYQDSVGYFWSSTVQNDDGAYDLYLRSSSATPGDPSSKYYGFSVRCVAMDTMQNFDPSPLSNTGDTTRLIDARDGNLYTVKRLKDGKVWMTENLRIAGKTITSADSNVTSDFTIPASSTDGFNTQDTNNAYIDSTYGGYYSFYTATAGTGGTSLATNGANAPSSICPKGWRLPTGGGTGEFDTLYRQYNSAALIMGVPNFTLSGNVYNGSVHSQGSYGYFWSSTVLAANSAYNLYLTSSGVGPAYDSNKNRGYPVRCVAEDRTTISDITYMQDMTSKIAENTPIDTVATLTDTRDNNTYTVRKLKDGKVWMTQNLKLINKTVSSTDSNLPSGETYTVPASNLSSFTTSYDTNSAYLDSTYGGYYNFYTATAGWGTTDVTTGNSPKDICPKGWRLPTGGSSGEFKTLYNNYNSPALMQGEPNFTLSGFVTSSVYSQGSRGDFWSSTVSNANFAYSLNLNSSDVDPANFSYRSLGFSVRCIAI